MKSVRNSQLRVRAHDLDDDLLAGRQCRPMDLGEGCRSDGHRIEAGEGRGHGLADVLLDDRDDPRQTGMGGRRSSSFDSSWQ